MARSITSDDVKVQVVQGMDDLMKVIAVRAAVFMGEQECPYHEEFDGNDHCATQLLATVDGEPVGVFRIRWFADFAKLERFAILEPYRGLTVSNALVRFALDLCRRKGFHTVYGQVETRVVRFWKRHGMQPVPGSSPIVFSDHEFIPMMGHIEASSDRLGLSSGDFVLDRPEGDWDRPGILEQSSDRPASNPGRKSRPEPVAASRDKPGREVSDCRGDGRSVLIAAE